MKQSKFKTHLVRYSHIIKAHLYTGGSLENRFDIWDDLTQFGSTPPRKIYKISRGLHKHLEQPDDDCDYTYHMLNVISAILKTVRRDPTKIEDMAELLRETDGPEHITLQ